MTLTHRLTSDSLGLKTGVLRLEQFTLIVGKWHELLLEELLLLLLLLYLRLFISHIDRRGLWYHETIGSSGTSWVIIVKHNLRLLNDSVWHILRIGTDDLLMLIDCWYWLDRFHEGAHHATAIIPTRWWWFIVITVSGTTTTLSNNIINWLCLILIILLLNDAFVSSRATEIHICRYLRWIWRWSKWLNLLLLQWLSFRLLIAYRI